MGAFDDGAWGDPPENGDDAEPFEEQRDTIETLGLSCFYCGELSSVPLHGHDAGNGTSEFFHDACHAEMRDAGECDDNEDPS
jgi:hypothetical protein